MAIQILPALQKQKSYGEILGTGLGEGLSALLQHKVGEMQTRKKSESWQAIGLPKEEADFIISQPEWLQKELVSRLDSIGSGQSEQSSQRIQSDQSSSRPTIFGRSSATKKEDAAKFKESKEFRHSVIEAKRAADSEIKDLGRLEELSGSGKLDTPGYIEFLKKSGLDIAALTSPESEEFQKIQQGFLKNAKQYFGSRISNYEVEQYLKTIPSLSQSPEGRQRVIANLKRLSRGAQERYKAYQEVLRENKGVPPYDIEEKVERKTEKRLDRIYEEFRKDLQKPTPKGQNKLITALQAGTGALVKPAGAALTGAALGSVVPGVGTLAGGAAGGLAGLGAKLSGLI